MFILEYKITITLERKICMKISGLQGVPFLTRGYAKRRNGFLWGLRYANVSLAHSGVESS